MVSRSWSGVALVGEGYPGVVPGRPPCTYPVEGSCCWGIEQVAVISQGIWASQKLSGGSILDLSKLEDPRTLGYLLIFGLYSKPKAYC